VCPCFAESATVEPSEPTRTSEIAEGEVDSTDNQEAESRSTYEVVTMPSRFAQSQGKGFIDVYWLYDDGGEKEGREG